MVLASCVIRLLQPPASFPSFHSKTYISLFSCVILSSLEPITCSQLLGGVFWCLDSAVCGCVTVPPYNLLHITWYLLTLYALHSSALSVPSRSFAPFSLTVHSLYVLFAIIHLVSFRFVALCSSHVPLLTSCLCSSNPWVLNPRMMYHKLRFIALHLSLVRFVAFSLFFLQCVTLHHSVVRLL